MSTNVMSTSGSADEWVAVTERLPKPYDSCIVYMTIPEGKTGSYYDFAFYAPPVGLHAGAWGRIPTFKRLRGTVTHWRPVPAAPTGDKPEEQSHV